jgi:hypothetical protein
MPIQSGVRFVPRRAKPADDDNHLIAEKSSPSSSSSGPERAAASSGIERMMRGLARERSKKTC